VVIYSSCHAFIGFHTAQTYSGRTTASQVRQNLVSGTHAAQLSQRSLVLYLPGNESGMDSPSGYLRFITGVDLRIKYPILDNTPISSIEYKL
jgi:hypothetical protein